MISSLVLCEALSDGHLPVSNGYLLFSALTRRLSERGVPECLHGVSGFNGAALSALTPESFWRTLHYSWGKGVLQLKKGEKLAFRVSFLRMRFWIPLRRLWRALRSPSAGHPSGSDTSRAPERMR